MSGQDSIGVTLAHVDPSLLSCWEEMVKRGEECSLLLKHRSGRITATLQCITSPASLSLTSPAGKIKKKNKNKGYNKKRLEDLLAYHQRLVVERGLPPSRLMMQHAAASDSASASPTQSTDVGKPFKCDQCDFSSDSKRGLKVHIGKAHKMLASPEKMRAPPSGSSLAVSPLKELKEIQKDLQNGFKCGGCEEVFNNEDDMNTHIENNHFSIRCGNCKELIWDKEPPAYPACPACFVPWSLPASCYL